DTVATQGQIGQYSGGLGISQNGSDNHQVDGYGIDELLVLAFSETVRIVSAEFRYVSSDDDFEFWHDNEPNGSLNGDYVFTADIPGSLVYVFAGNYVSSLFGIGATHYSDDFKLYALTVSPVPLPAALPLFAGAIGAFGASRWRKRRIVRA
ncbi:MAG TPA: VPLPA-CTERM sorting domain-containing protein, partial [Afifellaceae bacterium]|nr:VPLPA-CTERM sorting domain-containing protein [Afifellaceae bacterium]